MQPRVLDEKIVEPCEDEDACGVAEAGDRRQCGHHLAMLGWPDQVCAERGGEREREGREPEDNRTRVDREQPTGRVGEDAEARGIRGEREQQHGLFVDEGGLSFVPVTRFHIQGFSI